jgi:hypothetical protein
VVKELETGASFSPLGPCVRGLRTGKGTNGVKGDGLQSLPQGAGISTTPTTVLVCSTS